MQPRIITWGFQLEPETLHFLKYQIQELLEYCPDDSPADVRIAKTPSHFEMVVRIYYDGGSYIGKANSMLLTEAIHDVLDQIYDQVHTWRIIRNSELGMQDTLPGSE